MLLIVDDARKLTPVPTAENLRIVLAIAPDHDRGCMGDVKHWSMVRQPRIRGVEGADLAATAAMI